MPDLVDFVTLFQVFSMTRCGPDSNPTPQRQQVTHKKGGGGGLVFWGGPLTK